jgi:hypothetical protein
MTNEAQPDMTWSELSDMEGDGLVSAMQQRFEALAGLDQAAREQQSESMIRAEYMLEAELLGDFTEARLRSWMGVAGDNLSRAQDVASAYDKAFERVPGGMAMHHAALVQTVARERFTPEDIDVLFELVPRHVQNVPRASQEAVERSVGTARLVGSNAPSARKPWWKVW